MTVVDVKDFQTEVIKKSFEIPVVVDFWAEWCGPCKILGPVLEQLASLANGDWTLAKLDTETFPDIATQYNIRGIPAVKLFVDGQVINEFTGALPQYQVEYWLKQSLPDKYRRQLQATEYLMAEGKAEEAKAGLKQILQNDPQNETARASLAQLLLFEDPLEAETLVGSIEVGEHAELAEAVRTVALLSEAVKNPALLPDGTVKETYLEGAKALLSRDFPAALQKFIRVIREDRYYHDDGGRRACIAIFKLLGEEDPVTQEYRRDFSSALY